MMRAIEIPTMHKTRKLLLETVIQEISTRSTSDISSEEVLGITGISRGSLYHHFEDYSELVETAQLMIVKRFITLASDAALAAIEGCEDPEQAEALVMEVVENAHSSKTLQPAFSARVRSLRLELFVESLTSPRLLAQVQEMQESLTNTWIKTIDICKERGWADSELDSRSTAILIQSSFFGRTLDDFSAEKMELRAWTKSVQNLLKHFLFDGVAN